MYKFFFPTNFFFQIGGGGIWGVWGPPGGRAGSENDTLIPMTMTCDRLKFWNSQKLSWRRKNKK